MVNSKHPVKYKSTPKIDLCSSSRNMNDSQPKSAISGTNEDEKSFETVKKNYLKKEMKKNHCLSHELTAYLSIFNQFKLNELLPYYQKFVNQIILNCTTL